MMKSQNRIGRLLILLFPILLTGCADHFTLIGRVDLGGDVGEPIGNVPQTQGQDENDGPDAGMSDDDLCWPSARAAVAEMRSHGYTFKTWPMTADWMARLEPLAKSLPPCP